jgi:hypothetical protein
MGSGAIVESMFRLRDSVQLQDRTAKRLNTLLLWFTVAIFALTAVMCALAVLQLYYQLHPKPAPFHPSPPWGTIL